MTQIDKFEHYKSMLEELGYVLSKDLETSDSATYYAPNEQWGVQVFMVNREDAENNIIRYFPRDYSPGSLRHVELMEDPKTDYQVHYSPFYHDSMFLISML